MDNLAVQNLLNKAKNLAPQTGPKGRKRYSYEFKKIIRSLVLDHQLSVTAVASLTSVSRCSVLLWSQKKSQRPMKKTVAKKFNLNQFRKISVQKETREIQDLHLHIFSSIKSSLFLIVISQVLLLVLILAHD